MNFAKTIRIALALALLAAGAFSHAEEQHSVLDILSSTTLSGSVDTSASWWVGAWNDHAVNAIAVETNTVAVPSNLTQSTLESGEPVQTGQTGSVWYKWSATQSGVARISTTTLPAMPAPAATSTLPALSDESIFYPDGGISHDGSGGGGSVGGVIIINTPPPPPISIGFYRWWTDLAVYRAVRVSDTEMRFDFLQRGASLEFEAQAGEIFWVGVEVYERQPDFPGQIELPSPLPTTLFFDLTPPATNDSFASSLSVGDSSGGTMTGYALAATRESGEPDLGGEFSGGSVWFHFKAAMYGTVAISDISQNLPIGVFTGGAVSDLTLVAKSSAGGIAFFAEEGKLYHIAVFHGASTAGFNLSFIAPRYRVYETTIDTLMPNGAPPHFYGVRGATMLLYAKTATDWDLVEVESIVNETADLFIQPNPVDGQLRVITIDETLPSPGIVLSIADGSLNVNVTGIPGQTCGVSYSTDLFQWSAAQIITLKSPQTFVRSFDQTGSNYFFRVRPLRAPRLPPPPPVPM